MLLFFRRKSAARKSRGTAVARAFECAVILYGREVTALEASTAQNGTIAYFDALQVAVDKRAGQGLTWNVRYTFSKAINSTGTQSFANISGAGHTSTVEDIVRDMKSLEQFDTPQAFTIGYRYEFPWARGARGILSWFPGGWKLSGTTTFKSGTPTHEMAFDTFGKIINTANRGRVIQFLLRLQF